MLDFYQVVTRETRKEGLKLLFVPSSCIHVEYSEYLLHKTQPPCAWKDRAGH